MNPYPSVDITLTLGKPPKYPFILLTIEFLRESKNFHLMPRKFSNVTSDDFSFEAHLMKSPKALINASRAS